MQGGHRRRASVARKSRKRSDARLWPSPLTCQNLRVIAREVERWDRDVSSLRVGRSGLQQTRARLRPVLFFQIRADIRSEEHTSELQSQSNLVCRLLLEKK